jgi:hypothetical protein
MTPFEIVAGLVGKLAVVIIETIRASGLSDAEQAELLSRVTEKVDAAAARREATEIRDV